MLQLTKEPKYSLYIQPYECVKNLTFEAKYSASYLQI